VAALTSDGAALCGLDVGFHFAAYDWTKPAALRDAIGSIGVDDSVVAGSSEGGLFLYASEGDIMANLNVFRDCTPADAVMVGSFAREAATLDARLRTWSTCRGRPPSGTWDWMLSVRLRRTQDGRSSGPSTTHSFTT